jgi:hypothetical protein
MKKVVRLTESELTGLVRRVIDETKYKISKDERIVISDTENFLQVVPLTHTASCKYGSDTKWCVTGERGKSDFQGYIDRQSDVSMIMIKNPEIKEEFGTSKFAFNLYNNYLEIHNDKDRYFNLFTVAEDAGVLEEVKSLLDDYIRFMKENRGVEKIIIPKIDYSTPSL